MTDPRVRYEISAEDNSAAAIGSAQSRLASLEKSFTSLNRAADLFTRVLPTATIVAFGKAMFETADAIGDMSNRLGLSATELSRLKYIASQSDVEFQSLAVGIKNFQKNLSEGDKVFGQLGISAAALKNLSLTEQFEAMADAFQRVQNPADKTRIAMELFGKAGVDLIPLLDQGSDGIRKFGAEAERIGAVMSDKTAKGISEADEAIKRMTGSVRGAAAVILSELAPAITSAADGLRTLAGGATEAEVLQSKLEHLQEWRNEFVPIAFNFGYDDGLGFIAGPRALDKRIEEIKAKLESLKKAASSPPPKANIGPLANIAGEQLQEVRVTARQEGPLAGSSEEFLQNLLDQQAKREQQIDDERLRRAEKTAQQMQDFSKSIADDAIENNERWLQTELAATVSYSQQKMQAVFASEQMQQQYRAQTVSLFVQGLAMLGQHNKAAAIAAIAVNRAQAIANIIMHVSEANAKAISLGPWGWTLIAANVALGAAEIANVNKAAAGASSIGSAAIGPGSAVNPIFTSQVDNQQAVDSKAAPQKAVQIFIEGPIMSGQETSAWLIDQLKEAINDRDVVVINGNSAQARELAPA